MLTTINNLLESDELTRIRALLDQGAWHSGSSSAGAYAQKRKTNEEMDQTCNSWKEINQLVVSRLYQHPDFQSSVLPSKVSAAFVSRYTSGMAYGRHIDDPVMGTQSGRYRADVAVTVFLNEPTDYDGGELTIHTKFGAQSIKLNAGGVVAYPASSQHEVTRVTSGTRIVCVLWAQSLVRDAEKREILVDLDEARRALQVATPEAAVTSSVDRAYMNLVRMWADC